MKKKLKLLTFLDYIFMKSVRNVLDYDYIKKWLTGGHAFYCKEESEFTLTVMCIKYCKLLRQRGSSTKRIKKKTDKQTTNISTDNKQI